MRFGMESMRLFCRYRNLMQTMRFNSGLAKILGIESSCDETAAAIVTSEKHVLGHSLKSQLSVHLHFGGIIPLVARDLHKDHIEVVVNEALKQSSLRIEDLDAIAVTTRPGLKSCLRIGTNYAKFLCEKFRKPLIPVHHMEAHALTVRLVDQSVHFPFLVLLISGGHCLLAVAEDVDRFRLLGQTVDDSPGEILDKVSRELNLRTLKEFESISGGQAIEMAARNVKYTDNFQFPQPMSHYRDCNFSMSGLKSTAFTFINQHKELFDINENEAVPEYEDISYGLLVAISRQLCRRTQRAIEYSLENNLIQEHSNSFSGTLVVSGGVAANNFIFDALRQVCDEFELRIIRPEPSLCTDNGIMIAWNGMERWQRSLGILQPDSVEFTNLQPEPKCLLGENQCALVSQANMKCNWIKLEFPKSQRLFAKKNHFEDNRETIKKETLIF